MLLSFFSGKLAFYVAFQKKRGKSHLDDHRVAEVAQKREGPSPKSLKSEPWHMLFCCDCDIKIYRDLHAFWKTMDKKMFFIVFFCFFFFFGGGSETVFLGEEVHYYMYCIYCIYHTELNLEIWLYAQNDAFVAN